MYSFLPTLEWLLFLLLALFRWLEPPVQYWREVIRVSILVLFLILGENIQSFTLKQNISCWVIHRCSFSSWGNFLLFQVHWEVFWFCLVLLFLRARMDVGCVKCFFYPYQGGCMVFILMWMILINFFNVKPFSNTTRNVICST